jgi:oligopeptide transport system substrate-binding protein
MNRSVWAALAVAVAVAVVGSGAAATGTSAKSAAGVLRLAIESEPPSLDPGLATDTTSASVLLNLMDPLVKLGPQPKLKPIPVAAASWSVKGTKVTLRLRKDVRWTTGEPVTAQDYIWSWLRTISPQLGADYAYQFFGIKGAAEYNSCDPAKANCKALRGKVAISAPDRYTLRIQLTSAQPWFIQQLAHTSFFPVHRATVERHGKKWTEPRNIVTNGPFRLASWKHDASLTLVKNARWRNAESVKLNRVDLSIITEATTAQNAFDAGNLDVSSANVAPADVARYKKTPFWKVWPSLSTDFYGFNVKNIPDVNQRRAMAFAIDRQAITTHILQAGQLPAKGFTPIAISGGPTIVNNSSMPATANLERAKQFMAKVKKPKKDIRLFTYNGPGTAQQATAVQSYWKKLGLNVTIKIQEWKQYLEFLGPPPNRDVDVYQLGWAYDYPDAYNGLELWKCKSGNNHTNWCNPRFDALVEQATKVRDADERAGIYAKAEEILTGANGDLPIMPVYWWVENALVKPNVKGFTIVNGLWDLTNVAVA